MTEEHDAGFYLKRTRVAEMTFGDAAWDYERWVQQRGDCGRNVASRRVACCSQGPSQRWWQR